MGAVAIHGGKGKQEANEMAKESEAWGFVNQIQHLGEETTVNRPRAVEFPAGDGAWKGDGSLTCRGQTMSFNLEKVAIAGESRRRKQ